MDFTEEWGLVLGETTNQPEFDGTVPRDFANLPPTLLRLTTPISRWGKFLNCLFGRATHTFGGTIYVGHGDEPGTGRVQGRCSRSA